MVWLVQNCRSNKCLQFLKSPELQGPLGPLPGFCPGPAGDLKRPQTPRLLTPTLTTNPGSAPEYFVLCIMIHFGIKITCIIFYIIIWNTT